MSTSQQQQSEQGTSTSPARKVFNWADDDASSSDDDVPPEEVMTNHSPIAIPSTSPSLAPLAGGTLTPTNATTAADRNNVQASLGNEEEACRKEAALRDLLEAAALTPSRHCQEVTIQAAIPYKLKSVWNANNNSNASTAGNSPAPRTEHAARTHNTNALTTSAGPSSSVTPHKVGKDKGGASPSSSSHIRGGASLAAPVPAVRPAPLRKMNRAVDELTNVLRASDGSLPYDELMVKAQWRSRFQPSFGSLFTFIKRNREIFHYQQSVVELVKEGSIVAELLKMQWGTTSAVEINTRICGYGAAAGATDPTTHDVGASVVDSGGATKNTGIPATVAVSPNTAKHGAIGSKDASPATGNAAKF